MAKTTSLKLIVILLLIFSKQLYGQSPGVMTFGTSSTFFLIDESPSVNQSSSSLLNGFNISTLTTNDILIGFTNNPTESSISGTGDSALVFGAAETSSVHWVTLKTDSELEIGLTSAHFSLKPGSLPTSLTAFTFTAKRDGVTVGTLVINSPSTNTDITLDFTSPTTGSFTNIDEIVFTPSTAFYGYISIDDLTVVEKSISWTGATDTNWYNSSNWSTGVVPNQTLNAIIPNVSNAPIISSTNSLNALVKNLVIKTNASLTINTEKVIYTYGDLTNNGTLTFNSGTEFGALNVDGTATGNITFNKNIDNDKWHLISSALTGQSYNDTWVTDNAIASGTGNNRGISTYDNNGNAWEYFQAGNAGTFTSTNGYAIKKTTGGILSFNGTMHTENITNIPISEGSTNNWNLLGNPYLSFIFANSNASFSNNFLNVNAAAINDSHEALYVWDNAENSGTGGYVAINNASSKYHLSPGQGFFINSIDGGSTISFTTDMQSSNNGSVSDDARSNTNNPEVTLTISNETQTKSTEIKYLQNTTTSLDPGYDAGVFTGESTAFNIYTHLVSNSEGIDFALQCLPNNNFENMVIPVGINSTSGTEITFSAEALNLPKGIKVFLEDRETNAYTRLDEASNSYKITLNEAVSGIGRFYLHTSSSSTLNNNNDLLLQNVSIYKSANSTLKITGLQKGKTTAKLFTILGKQIMNSTFQTNGVQDISLPKLASGVYIIQLQTYKGKLSKKLILE